MQNRGSAAQNEASESTQELAGNPTGYLNLVPECEPVLNLQHPTLEGNGRQLQSLNSPALRQAFAEKIISILQETVDCDANPSDLYNDHDNGNEADCGVRERGLEGTEGGYSVVFIRKHLKTIKDELFALDVKKLVKQLAFVQAIQEVFNEFPEPNIDDPSLKLMPGPNEEQPESTGSALTGKRAGPEDRCGQPYGKRGKNLNEGLSKEGQQKKQPGPRVPPMIFCFPQVVEDTNAKLVVLLNNKTFTVDKASSAILACRTVACHVCGRLFKFSQLRYHAYCSKRCIPLHAPPL